MLLAGVAATGFRIARITALRRIDESMLLL